MTTWHLRVSPYGQFGGTKQGWLVSRGHEPEADDDIPVAVFHERAVADAYVATSTSADDALVKLTYSCVCPGCGREIVVTAAINGLNHNIGVWAACKDAECGRVNPADDALAEAMKALRTIRAIAGTQGSHDDEIFRLSGEALARIDAPTNDSGEQAAGGASV